MRPNCKITIDGILASDFMMSRVISCEVMDKEGVSSDTCRIEMNNSPAVKIPRRGAKIRIWMGYGSDVVFMGTFVVDETSLSLFPHKMSITGKAADWREKMKENKERHWDAKTVKNIVSQIASDHGLKANVDSGVGAHLYDWFGQQDESDINVLRRLEQRHGALFSIKDGMLIFVKRGAGKTATGVALNGIKVSQDNIVEGSGKITLSDRAEYKEVVAYHQNKDEAKREEISIASSSSGAAIYRMGEPFSSVGEATAAAKSKAEELKRQAIKFSCTIFGNPAARAGAPLVFLGMEVGIDGFEFIIETARHSWSKSGYTTALDGELKI